MSVHGKKVLCVGLICLDTVNICDGFPTEDTDKRCKGQHWARGGNASNNCTILSQLDVSCEVLGTFANDFAGKFLQDDLFKCGVKIDHCVVHKGFATPTSCVIINTKSGSRTILHADKDLPEVSFQDFCKLNLAEYSWIHFEGRSRNVLEIQKMIQYVRDYNKCSDDGSIRVSVEIEKPTEALAQLLPLADFVFIGKDFATFRGYVNMDSAVSGLQECIKDGATIICPWGEQGACARTSNGMVLKALAVTQGKVVDTLGAGDTFFAGCIAQLNKGRNVNTAIQFGCQVAGLKCTHYGLKDFLHSIQQSSAT